MSAKKIITPGDRFGRWVVVFEMPHKEYRTMFCRCNCGIEREVRLLRLTSGTSKSCGCLNSDIKLIHGNAKRNHISSAYYSWQCMKARCDNPKNDSYQYYGACGITYCQEWENFEKFLIDMGEKPKGTTLDRINGKLGYFKGNCRWATRKEQARNTRSNFIIEFKGERKSLTEWAEILGIKSNTLWVRIKRYGWTIERALNV